MKEITKIFGPLLLIFVLFSCGKDVNPRIQVFVSAKKSDLYQSIAMNHGRIEIFTDENGGPFIHDYTGIDVNLDLTTDDNSILVGEVSVSNGMYFGLQAELYVMEVHRIEGVEIGTVISITDPEKKFGGEFELLDNREYRIDFIYDIDKSMIMFSPTEYDFDTVVEIKITQL